MAYMGSRSSVLKSPMITTRADHEAHHEAEEPCEARDALRRACARAAASGGWVLGIGSLYLAGALRGDTGPPADPDRSPCSP